MPLRRWSRLYISQNGHHYIALVVTKVERGQNPRWASIRGDRQVFILDTSDRNIVSGRPRAGVQYGGFPALSAAEKRTACARAVEVIQAYGQRQGEPNRQ